MKAIQIEVFGNPAEVVKAVDLPDIGAPAAGEVVIAVQASPINQYDLLRRNIWVSLKERLHSLLVVIAALAWPRQSSL
jgi:NADPH:quinone reductase-like Zn-dependent oxidoreductase